MIDLDKCDTQELLGIEELLGAVAEGLAARAQLDAQELEEPEEARALRDKVTEMIDARLLEERYAADAAFERAVL